MAFYKIQHSFLILKTFNRSSGQDGGKGKHALPSYTAREKITTKLQNKYHPDFQNIKLYGSTTTKDLKKPHSSTWVGRVKTWRYVEWHRAAQRRGEAMRDEERCSAAER